MSALAFAQGNDIHVPTGGGLGTIAHEAAHVVQQQQGRVSPTAAEAAAKSFEGQF